MRTSTQVGRRRGRVLPTVLAATLLAAPAAQATYQLRPGAETTPPSETPVVVVESGNGFDWGDAGVGAGAAVGITLVGGAAAAALIRRRRVRAAH